MKIIQDLIFYRDIFVIGKESCPVFPGNAVRIHQIFEDPPPATVGDYESRLENFRRVRDEIRNWLREFADK